MPDVDITQKVRKQRIRSKQVPSNMIKLAVVSKKVGPLLRAQSLRKKYIPRTTTTKTPITDALIGQGPVDMSPGTKILVTMSPHALSRTGKTCHPHTIDSVTDASCPKPLTTKVTIATNAHALSRTGSIGALSMMNTVTKAPASKHSPPLSRKKRAGASDNTDQAPAPKKSKSTKKPLKTKIKAGALLLPPEFHYPQLDDFDGDVGKWLNAYNNIPTAWKREPTPDDFGNNLLKLSIAINDILVQEHRAKEAWEAAKCKTPGSTREESLITNDLVDDAEAAEGEEVSEHDQFIRAGGAGGDKSE